MGFKLIIRGPDNKIQEYAMAEGETAVGRDPANVLVLEGRGVSRRHAKLICKAGRLYLTDLGSTYGTRVNDIITMHRELHDGDTVTIGMYYLLAKQVHEEGASRRGAMPFDQADTQEEAFEGDEVTQAPPADIHRRKTLQMNRNAIQFILDNPDADGRAVKVLPKEDSSLVKAVERLGATARFGPSIVDTQPSQSGDYPALLLMYKVSELLAGATGLKEFVEPVADLVLESVGAATVVLLTVGEGGEPVPLVIRHRGQLQQGEVPVSRGIVDRVLKERVAVMSNDVSHDSRLQPGKSVMLYNIFAAMAFPLLVRGELRGALYLSRSVAKPFTVADGDLVAALTSLVASGIERSELKEHVAEEKQQRKALERFHPPQVAEELFRSGVGESTLKERQVTALVCTLQGFNELVSRVEPIKLASVLHEYYELLYEKVFANGGSLVKLHDGWALALFGSPQSTDRDAGWAVESARLLCQEFSGIARLWPGSQSLALGCGLDTGGVVAGVVGSADRLEYAALGPPISTASYVASQARGTGILLTERTWANLPKKRLKVEALPQIADVQVYRLEL